MAFRLAPSLKFVLELLPRDFRKTLSRDSCFKPAGLCVALPQVHCVEIVLVIQACFDQLLHPEDRGRLQALQFCQNKRANGSLERGHGLLREDRTVAFRYSQHRRRGSKRDPVAYL